MSQTVVLNAGQVGLFGYGSLLLKSSMERTLGRPYDGERYVCELPGWRRTWDSLYPNKRYYFLNSDSTRCYPDQIVYLNITRAATVMNGLLYVISTGELEGFDAREIYYERLDIGNELAGVEVRGGPAYVYVGKPQYVLTRSATAQEAAIRKSYIRIVEDGLNELGSEFRALYERSTDPPPEGNIVDDRLD